MDRSVAPTAVPMEIEQRIRAAGAALDLAFARALYSPLLANQPRDGVKVVHDLAYGEDPRHRLDIYCPEHARARPSTVLVFMHGGGFIRGDKSDRENFGQYFARQGLTVVIPNYRLAPAHPWPSGAEDVLAAYRWSRDNAARYGGDASQIVLAGESAGAAHVALAILARRFRSQENLIIAGAVLISGVYNVQLEKLARRQFGIGTPDHRNEAYFGCDFGRYPSLSTVELIDAPPIPLLITYAELDMVQMQVQAGELFARLVTRHGYSPEIRVIRGHNHLTQAYAVNTGDESLSGSMLDFVRRNCAKHHSEVT